MSLVDAQKGMTDLQPFTSDCGGNMNGYSWSQTEEEVVVSVPLPEGTTGKQVEVLITPTTFRCGLKSAGAAGAVLGGPLYKPIKAEDSTWTVEGRKLLGVTLCKTNMKYEEWWPHVCTNEPQMDVKTLIPPSKHVKDMDSGAQATVAKMMFDQEQKRKGLPTSDETKASELLQSMPPPPAPTNN